MQINIDKIRKFSANVTICTKYIDGSYALIVLTKISLKPDLTGHCCLIFTSILGKVGGTRQFTE